MARIIEVSHPIDANNPILTFTLQQDSSGKSNPEPRFTRPQTTDELAGMVFKALQNNDVEMFLTLVISKNDHEFILAKVKSKDIKTWKKQKNYLDKNGR